jgi:hypothetical protein
LKSCGLFGEKLVEIEATNGGMYSNVYLSADGAKKVHAWLGEWLKKYGKEAT